MSQPASSAGRKRGADHLDQDTLSLRAHAQASKSSSSTSTLYPNLDNGRQQRATTSGQLFRAPVLTDFRGGHHLGIYPSLPSFHLLIPTFVFTLLRGFAFGYHFACAPLFSGSHSNPITARHITSPHSPAKRVLIECGRKPSRPRAPRRVPRPAPGQTTAMDVDEVAPKLEQTTAMEVDTVASEVAHAAAVAETAVVAEAPVIASSVLADAAVITKAPVVAESILAASVSATSVVANAPVTQDPPAVANIPAAAEASSAEEAYQKWKEMHKRIAAERPKTRTKRAATPQPALPHETPEVLLARRKRDQRLAAQRTTTKTKSATSHWSDPNTVSYNNKWKKFPATVPPLKSTVAPKPLVAKNVDARKKHSEQQMRKQNAKRMAEWEKEAIANYWGFMPVSVWGKPKLEDIPTRHSSDSSIVDDISPFDTPSHEDDASSDSPMPNEDTPPEPPMVKEKASLNAPLLQENPSPTSALPKENPSPDTPSLEEDSSSSTSKLPLAVAPESSPGTPEDRGFHVPGAFNSADAIIPPTEDLSCLEDAPPPKKRVTWAISHIQGNVRALEKPFWKSYPMNAVVPKGDKPSGRHLPEEYRYHRSPVLDDSSILSTLSTQLKSSPLKALEYCDRSPSKVNNVDDTEVEGVRSAFHKWSASRRPAPFDLKKAFDQPPVQSPVKQQDNEQNALDLELEPSSIYEHSLLSELADRNLERYLDKYCFELAQAATEREARRSSNPLMPSQRARILKFRAAELKTLAIPTLADSRRYAEGQILQGRASPPSDEESDNIKHLSAHASAFRAIRIYNNLHPEEEENWEDTIPDFSSLHNESMQPQLAMKEGTTNEELANGATAQPQAEVQEEMHNVQTVQPYAEYYDEETTDVYENTSVIGSDLLTPPPKASDFGYDLPNSDEFHDLNQNSPMSNSNGRFPSFAQVLNGDGDGLDNFPGDFQQSLEDTTSPAQNNQSSEIIELSSDDSDEEGPERQSDLSSSESDDYVGSEGDSEEVEEEEEAEEEEAEEEEEGETGLDPRAPVVALISPGLRKTLDVAINKGSGPGVKHHPTFSGQDLSRLIPNRFPGASHGGPKGWLNDECIDTYLEFLTKAANRKLGIDQDDRSRKEPLAFYAFSSKWWPDMSKKGYSAVARWTRRPRLSNGALLKSRKLFFPVNINGNHWTLLVINPENKTIEFLNSLSGHDDEVLRVARTWLSNELGGQYVASEWKELRGRSSQQNNMSDCGVFTLMNALATVRNIVPRWDVQADDMQVAREMIAATLVVGGFAGELDWSSA